MKLHEVYGPPPEGEDVLYRVEARRYSYVIDADTERYGTTAPRLELVWFHVAKRTPKGARLLGGKFVLLAANKRYACNTVEEAIESFRARKNRQIKILSARLNDAMEELALIQKL